jgi:hypothetical protein
MCRTHSFVSVPLHADPYDPSSAPLGRITPLLPFQLAARVTIPLTGTTSKSVGLSAFDLSGLASQTSLYDPCSLGPTAHECSQPVDAASSTGFLGQVFLCNEGPDVLSIEMFTTGGSVLEWLSSHPGIQDTANVAVQFSELDNQLEAIAALTTGVILRVGVGVGTGFGRVIGVSLVEPSLATGP